MVYLEKVEYFKWENMITFVCGSAFNFGAETECGVYLPEYSK